PCDGFVAVMYSTWITRRDAQATSGALIVAVAADLAAKSRDGSTVDVDALFDFLRDESSHNISGSDLARNMSAVKASFRSGHTLEQFVSTIHLNFGVTGYIAHTVPVAIYAFLKYPDDYRTAVESVIRLGGDTDTVAAITGAL